MKKGLLYFLLVFNLIIICDLRAQLPAPQLRCISVNAAGDVVLTWIPPPDPSGLFIGYEIYSTATGINYGLLANVNSYSQTSFTHVTGAGVGNIQSQSYFIKTVSNTPGSVSTSSDTLRSIFLNMTGASVNGVASLNWNAIKTPLLPSSSSTYTLSREYPANTWTTIYVGNKLNYKDTIYRCKVFYNYKVEISDASGCTSVSNIKGDTCKNIQPPPIILIDSVSVNAAGQVVMGWQPSSSLDVDAYLIFLSNGSGLTTLDTVHGYNSTSFNVPGASPGTSSSAYCMSPFDSCGIFAIPSLIHNTVFLTAPVYDLCSRTAVLSWTPYLIKDGSGAVKGKYDICDIYCSVNGGTYTKIGSTSGSTTFSHVGLTPGDTYCYYIRVWNANRTISSSSNITCFTATGLPGPTYVYINSVSVNTGNKQMEISFSVDLTNPFKGCNIYKSEDGINFTKLAFVASSTLMPQMYTDADVKTLEKNYYYKIQAADDCNNPGVWSDTSKSVVLYVSNDKENIFYNTLTWDDYTKWSGGVASFNIYRAVNGVFDPTPISNVPVGTKTYIDNVQDFVSAHGKFTYYVEAVEGSGNIYGFMDKAKSNPADAYVEVSVFVPNAFAPKGINNVWLPVAQYVEKTDYKVMVFNRYGVKIFETNSDTEGWTGDAATDDVYVYMVEYKNARGEFIQLKGHLTIIR